MHRKLGVANSPPVLSKKRMSGSRTSHRHRVGWDSKNIPELARLSDANLRDACERLKHTTVAREERVEPGQFRFGDDPAVSLAAVAQRELTDARLQYPGIGAQRLVLQHVLSDSAMVLTFSEIRNLLVFGLHSWTNPQKSIRIEQRSNHCQPLLAQVPVEKWIVVFLIRFDQIRERIRIYRDGSCHSLISNAQTFLVRTDSCRTPTMPSARGLILSIRWLRAINAERMQMSRSLRNATFLLFIAALMVFSCARQPDPSRQLTPGELGFTSQAAGFLVGLFHGVTIVINMFASLIFDVRIYAFPNSGLLYDLGFMLGAAAALGGGASVIRPDRSERTTSPSVEPAISTTCPSCGWLIRPSGSRLSL